MTPTSAEIRAAREAAHRTKETNMKGIISALESAIFAETPFAVGEWSVNAGEGYVQLVWTCDQADTPEMYGDEPWSEWGGNSILDAAGVRQFDDSGADRYTDRFGDLLVAQWVQWNE